MANGVQHLPFSSVWKMRIDHPYSLFVRDSDAFWSCGQCPLDPIGGVLFPGDLVAQTRAVAGFIVDDFLPKIGAGVEGVMMLVVYYVKTSDGEGLRVGQVLNERFGKEVIVVPVAVPHFYYEGMMVEIDVFGASGGGRAREVVDENTGARLNIVEADGVGYASLVVPEGTSEVGEVVQRLLDKGGMGERIMGEQCFVASEELGKQLQTARSNRLATGCEIVGVEPDGFAVVGQFTLAKGQVTQTMFLTHEHGIEEVTASISRSGPFFEVMAACTEPVGLVEETRRIMQAIEWTLQRHELSFSDVRKSTTHYIAGSSEEELHDNMSVRNGYYTKPGPASTGLPVLSFPLARSHVSVRIFGKSSQGRSDAEIRRQRQR